MKRIITCNADNVNKLSDHDIQVMLSKEIGKYISDTGIGNAIRKIIFSCCKDVNWQEANQVMIEQMPELKLKY